MWWHCNDPISRPFFSVCFGAMAENTPTDGTDGAAVVVSRGHSGYGIGQWEYTLHSNISFHWLSPWPKCSKGWIKITYVNVTMKWYESLFNTNYSQGVMLESTGWIRRTEDISISVVEYFWNFTQSGNKKDLGQIPLMWHFLSSQLILKVGYP